MSKKMKVREKMDINERYLSGEEINESGIFNFKEVNSLKIQSKNSFLLEMAKRKKIVHLGFCDHIHLIDEGIKNNTWLHAKLCKVADRCIGIDINSEAVEHIKKLGIDDVYCIDITNPPNLQLDIFDDKSPYDYILLPDVIEHLDNPAEFLSALNKNYGHYYKNIIITVPNAFSFRNMKNAIKNKEIINTDHRHWFSPYTLVKYLYIAGYNTKDIYFADAEFERVAPLQFHWKLPLRMLKYFYYRMKSKRHPMLRTVIICICEQRESEND